MSRLSASQHVGFLTAIRPSGAVTQSNIQNDSCISQATLPSEVIFAQIRDKVGSPELALLPIGAYEPRWFMSPVHMAPEEAVRAHEILGAKTSIAIHHGTFQLADDGIDTPQRRLMACRRADSFVILKNGQFAEIP